MDIDGDGKISDDAYNDSKGHFKKAAELAKALGLAWGGDWRFYYRDGHMVTEPVMLTPDQDGALQYPGLSK